MTTEVKSTLEKDSKKKKITKEIRSLILIVLLIFAFRSTFFEPFRIPSGSMIPTLMIGDFILVNKLAYGLKVPFSDMFVPFLNISFGPVYIFKRKPPQRGDVIVFRYPRDISINYIKRVVGVPGDTLEIINRTVYINGVPLQTKEILGKEIMEDMDDKFKEYNLAFYETTTGDHHHITQINRDNHYQVDYKKTVVPEGHYFTMGDNRDFSSDSRFWGFVPEDRIRGEAVFVWFSMILGLGHHGFKMRPWRIGTLIK